MFEACSILPVEFLPSMVTEKIVLQQPRQSAGTRHDILNSFALHMKEMGMLHLKRLKDLLAESQPEEPAYTGGHSIQSSSKGFSV
jgi:hypothetical protein